jgi:hypothetical protein
MHATQSETKGIGRMQELCIKPLRITLIGGHMRNVRHLIERGRVAGWRIERHSGDVGGRGTRELRSQIARADIVIITTQVNSHGSMFLAKDYARRLGRFTTIIRREKFAELENAIIQFQKTLTGNEAGDIGNGRTNRNMHLYAAVRVRSAHQYLLAT